MRTCSRSAAVKELVLALRPEGAQYVSPGQRPGKRIANEPIALKGNAVKDFEPCIPVFCEDFALCHSTPRLARFNGPNRKHRKIRDSGVFHDLQESPSRRCPLGRKTNLRSRFGARYDLFTTSSREHAAPPLDTASEWLGTDQAISVV